MSDTVFRSQTVAPAPTVHTQTTHTDTSSPIKSDTIEVPYMDYETEHGRPYLADHFQLGSKWADSEGGFPREVLAIQGYITEKIKTGEIANSQSAVKDMLKGMEKLNNLSKEERTVVKLEVLSHYIEFLQKNDTTRKNLRRYNAY